MNEPVRAKDPLPEWHRNGGTIPTERFGAFQTHDGIQYQRDKNSAKLIGAGTIRRVIPKVRGKSARRANKAARMRARETK